MMRGLKTGILKVGMSIGLDDWETAKHGLMDRLRSRFGGLMGCESDDGDSCCVEDLYR